MPAQLPWHRAAALRRDVIELSIRSSKPNATQLSSVQLYRIICNYSDPIYLKSLSFIFARQRRTPTLEALPQSVAHAHSPFGG